MEGQLAQSFLEQLADYWNKSGFWNKDLVPSTVDCWSPAR